MPRPFVLFFAVIATLQFAASAQCAGQADILSPSCDARTIHVYLDQKTALVGGDKTVVAAEVLTGDMANVREGTEVTFVLQKEDQTVRRTGIAKNGIAHAYLYAGTVSGPANVWAEIGELRSETQTLLILAGPPRNFKLAATGCRAGVSCQLETTNLRDRFGNRVPDGVVGVLSVYSGGDLVRQQHVQTVRGSVLINWSKPENDTRVELVFADQVATLRVPAR